MSSVKFQEFWGIFVTVVIDICEVSGCPAKIDLSSPTPENRTLPDRFWRPVCAQRGWIGAVYPLSNLGFPHAQEVFGPMPADGRAVLHHAQDV
jgi:hypothetical protein